MGALLGMGSSLLGNIGNDISSGLTTAAQQGQAQGMADQGVADASQNSALGQQQSAAQSQGQINRAQGQMQTNLQNTAAANAEQAAVNQGNALLDQVKINAAEEKQREAGFSAALGSMAS